MRGLTVRAQHLCFDVQRALEGFIARGGTLTGTLDFYNDLSNPTHVGKSVIYITQTLVGDAFVVCPSRSVLQWTMLTNMYRTIGCSSCIIEIRGFSSYLSCSCSAPAVGLPCPVSTDELLTDYRPASRRLRHLCRTHNAIGIRRDILEESCSLDNVILRAFPDHQRHRNQ